MKKHITDYTPDAVEVYVQNNIIQIDFDMGWQLNQSLQSQNNLPL